jgi:hypothetical protein
MAIEIHSSPRCRGDTTELPSTVQYMHSRTLHNNKNPGDVRLSITHLWLASALCIVPVATKNKSNFDPPVATRPKICV